MKRQAARQPSSEPTLLATIISKSCITRLLFLIVDKAGKILHSGIIDAQDLNGVIFRKPVIDELGKFDWRTRLKRNDEESLFGGFFCGHGDFPLI
jgi:hypothetical protein